MKATSTAALESLKPVLPHLEQAIYDAIRKSEPMGLTRDDIAVKTGILIQTVCGRVLHLLDLNMIYESRTTRPTRSGRAAAVLFSTLNGRQQELPL